MSHTVCVGVKMQKLTISGIRHTMFIGSFFTQMHNDFIQVILGDNKAEFDVIFGRSKDEKKVLMENLQCLTNSLDEIVPYGFSNVSKMQIRALSVPSCSFYG